MNTKLIAVAIAAFVAAPVLSGTGNPVSAQPAARSEQHATTEGEVRKVDKDTQKLTIRHGAIKNLDMPPMTMVFQVKDAAMLESVKAGDKVRFAAEKIGGAFTVTHIETTK